MVFFKDFGTCSTNSGLPLTQKWRWFWRRPIRLLGIAKVLKVSDANGDLPAFLSVGKAHSADPIVRTEVRARLVNNTLGPLGSALELGSEIAPGTGEHYLFHLVHVEWEVKLDATVIWSCLHCLVHHRVKATAALELIP